MRLAPPISLPARFAPEPAPAELWLRYGAATAATLLALAGAQLILSNVFIAGLALVTLIGTPVSLALRQSQMRIGRYEIPRFLLNSLTVLATILVAGVVLTNEMGGWLNGAFARGNWAQTFWLRFSAGQSVALIMEAFLVFAAFRSFSLITDKDATLTTVPSFSTLLLLIPVLKSIEVVIYFLLWTVAAATLLALDHRSESRDLAQAYVPAPVPGQDARLSARGLATVLAFSLACAVGLSYFLSSRDPEQKSAAETAVSNLAGRLTKLALNLPETSVNAGPERQIDFAAGPTLPTQSLLWLTRSEVRTQEGVALLRPQYWRMFTLARYDGASWSQDSSEVRRIALQEMTLARWRRPRNDEPRFETGERPRNYVVPGFDVAQAVPRNLTDYGPAPILVRQRIQAQITNLGFLPVLPGVRTVWAREIPFNEIRARLDGAIDVGVMVQNQELNVLALVPPSPAYGTSKSEPPTKLELKPNPQAVLSGADRAAYLQLPPKIPRRVRDFGASALRDTPDGESAYRRAQRLSFAVQENAVYTLRPPTVPTGRDATDFFLFEGRKRGYCTYFAGALTALCRTQGIPARIVSGFVDPEYSDNGSTTVLREANAHAWTEVWVENWGWAVVDATPAGDRGDNAPTWLENWGDLFGSRFSGVLIWAQLHWRPVAFLGLALFGLYFLWRRRALRTGWRFRWGRPPLENDAANRAQIAASYERAARRLARRFRPRAPGETPAEWLRDAEKSLALADFSPLRSIFDLYLRARYAAEPLSPSASEQARQALEDISWKRTA